MSNSVTLSCSTVVFWTFWFVVLFVDGNTYTLCELLSCRHSTSRSMLRCSVGWRALQKGTRRILEFLTKQMRIGPLPENPCNTRNSGTEKKNMLSLADTHRKSKVIFSTETISLGVFRKNRLVLKSFNLENAMVLSAVNISWVLSGFQDKI